MSELPYQFYIVIGALTALGLALAWMGFRRLFNRRLVIGSTNIIVGLLLLTLCAATIGGVANLYTYLQLTSEELVGTIDFQKYSNQEYIAKLTRADGDIKHYTVLGDECQLDARILKWNGASNLLGFNTLYRLERISGRYSDTTQDETSKRSVRQLSEKAGIELWQIINSVDDWIPWVDAIYGNAVYVPMSDGASYRVTVTISGLTARPENAEAKKAIQSWE